MGEFATGIIRFTNRGSNTLKHGKRTMVPGETEDFDDLCSFLRFIEGSEAVIYEPSPGEFVEQLNAMSKKQGCGVTVKGKTLPPRGESPDESPPEPGEADSASRLGAPGSGADGSVQAGAPDPADDPRQPTQQLHDPAAPLTEGELGDVAMAKGATPEEAGEAVDRAKKGKPPEGAHNATHGKDRAGDTAKGGDPVDLFDGSFTLGAVDLEVPTPFLPLRFERTYRSGTPSWGPLGYNWDHNWNVYLRPLSDGSVGRWNGLLHEDVFTTTDGVTFDPPRGVFERLTRQQGDVYQLEARGGVVLVFERPANWGDGERIPLRRMADRFDHALTLQYDSADLLESVVDDDGRGLFLTNGKCGLVEQVRDHTGRTVDLVHDDDATHLVRVVGPGDRVSLDPYAVTEYEYSREADHPATRHNIVRVLDGSGDALVRNSFGDDPAAWTWNRVVEQWQGDDRWSFDYRQLQWLAPIDEHVNEGMWQTEVTEPDGTLRVHTFNFRGDLLDERFRLVADGSFRVVSIRRSYDEQGNLTERRVGDDAATVWSFDHANADPRHRGTLLSVTLRPPLGIPSPPRVVERIRYEPTFQQPIEEIDEAGSRTSYQYDPVTGALVGIDWPTVTLPDGSAQSASTVFELNGDGQVTATTTPAGVRNEVRYLAAPGPSRGFPDRLIHDVGGAAEEQHVAFTPEGWLRSITDGLGVMTAFAYDPSGRPVGVNLPPVDGNEATWTYRRGPQGMVVAVERPAGAYREVPGSVIIDLIERDPLGRPTSVVVGSNSQTPALTSLLLDHRGNVVRERDPAGVLTRRCFDERGLLLREVVDADGDVPLTRRMIHDRGGNAIAVDDRGLRVEHEHDRWGRVARRVGADGTEVRYRYGPTDRLVSTVVVGDPGDGSPARVLRNLAVDHDERHRPIRSRISVFTDDPGTATELVSTSWFDEDGRKVRHLGPTGGVTTTTYDGLDRTLSVTDPVGNVVEYAYGPAGSTTTVTSREVGPSGTVVSWVREDNDARRRKWRMTTSAGSSVSFRHDDRDLIIEATDAVGTVSRFEHDLWGNVVTRIADAEGVNAGEAYHRDRVGRLLSYRDPTSEVSSILRDVLGREREVRIGGVYATGRRFDGNGRVAGHDLPDGAAIGYLRDDAGRVVRMTVTGGAGAAPVAPHSYRHDGLGRLVEARVGSEVLRWEYDSLDRVVAETGPAGTFRREFDNLNQTASTVWPSGRKETIHWDALGRATKIELTQPDGILPTGAPGDVLAELEFEGLTKVVALRNGSGAATLRRHDAAGRVAEATVTGSDGTQLVTRYAYDASGRRRLDSETAAPARHRRVDPRSTGELERWETGVAPMLAAALDQAGQDAAVAAAGAAVTTGVVYGLDAAGARTSTTTTNGGISTVSPLSRGAAHRLEAEDGTPVTTDAAGRRRDDGRYTYDYDALGRAIRVTSAGGAVAEFRYDPAGRLSTSTVDGTSIHHRYLGGLLLADYDAAGAPVRLRSFHPGLIGPIVETTASGIAFLHYDHRLDLIATTGADGTVIDRYRYDPFGTVAVRGPTGTSRQAPVSGVAPVFGGMSLVAGTELYWTPARLYDPRTGLFCALDPRGLAGAADPYAYCSHSPLDYLDPAGEIAPLVVIGIMAGVGALLGGGAAWWSGGDVWDIFAGAAIGGVVGGLGGWMFSAVAGSATAAIGTWLGGTTLAGTGTASMLASVGGGAAGGLVSGTAAGGLSGSAHGAWGAWRGDGDIATAAWEGAKREAWAGGVSGLLAGGMFSGLMRGGVIPAATAAPGVRATAGMTAFRDTSIAAGQQTSRRAAMMPGVLARGMVSPWGIGGAAGSGFVGGYSAQVTRDVYEGRDVDDALSNSWDEGLEGAVFNMAGQTMHPVTHRYWKTRLSVETLDEIAARRVGKVALDGSTARHHQRNAAQYPEFAFPVPRQGEVQPLMTRLANQFSRGNVTGTYSDYQNRPQHVAWHEMWRTPDVPPGSSWTRVPTHGPFTPAWNPYMPQVDADPQATEAPEKQGK